MKLSPDRPAVLPEFLEGPAIPGLIHIPEFVSPEEQTSLAAELADMRRKYAFLLRQEYFGECLMISEPRRRKKFPLPPVMTDVVGRIAGVVAIDPQRYRHLQVNRYKPGRGIADHVDPLGIDHGAVVTLGTGSVIEFTPPDGKEDRTPTRMLLRPGDAYIMTGEVRHYIHGIDDTLIDDFRGQQYGRDGERTALMFGTFTSARSDAA